MNFLPSLVGWQWAVLAAVPISIVLLYFLKLRRQPIKVPSTFLWAKTIEDLHVNSLLQRLRRSLLLLLQLLAVLLATLALLRPGFHDVATSTGRKIFLIDHSASMQTIDPGATINRLDQAKTLVAQAIDALSDRDVAMLIAFSDRADVLQSFTADRRRLRDALQRLEVTSRPTDILEALRAADGLANPNRTNQVGDTDDSQGASALPADLLVYSDGGFNSARDFDLGNLKPTYVQVGSDESITNLSILAFSVERNPEMPDQIQAFATVANTGTLAVASKVTLSLDGVFIDADEVSLEPGAETGLSFVLEVDEANRLELALEIDDALQVDNFAHTGIAPLRLVNVLVVTPGNLPLDLALTTGQAELIADVESVAPDYLLQPAYQQRAAAGSDDLIIYDRCAPSTMPRSNTFFIGSIPPTQWAQSETSGQILLVDIDRTHPIMRYLELFSLLIAEGRTLTPPPGAIDLLTAENGSILSLAQRDGYQDMVLGFEILSMNAQGESSFNTDWQVQRSWPVFMLNLLRHLAGASQGGTLASFRPGQTVAIRTENRQNEVVVESPGGQQHTLNVGGGGIQFSRTEEIGFYEIRQAAGRTIDRFVVNLFDRQESTVAAAQSVSLGYETVDAIAATTTGRREFWRLLLVCVLGVMTLEWWFYARRLG